MTQKTEKKYRVAIVSPTPFYYHAPLYQRLAASKDIELMVYYCSDETLHGKDVARMYKTKGHFLDSELLKGYSYSFLKNYSLMPSYFKWPFGLVNWAIIKEIKNGNYDVVILQSWTNATWWLAFFAGLTFGVPVVFMTDENILSKASKPLWKKILKRMLIGNFIFTFASGFLTAGLANEELYQYFGVPPNKLFLFSFSWGYEEILAKAKTFQAQRNGLRNSFGLVENDFVVLYVGRLSKEKNIFTLLDAYRAVKNPRKKLLFVGDGPMREEIQKYVGDFNIPGIRFMGFQGREKIFNFYVAADVLILPSSYEPWGIVVNEAMCFGLPVIASNHVGAAVDLIQHGSNGFIFDYTDAKASSDDMALLMDFSKKDLAAFGENSREIISEWVKSLDAPRIIIGMIDVFKKRNAR